MTATYQPAIQVHGVALRSKGAEKGAVTSVTAADYKPVALVGGDDNGSGALLAAALMVIVMRDYQDINREINNLSTTFWTKLPSLAKAAAESIMIAAACTTFTSLVGGGIQAGCAFKYGQGAKKYKDEFDRTQKPIDTISGDLKQNLAAQQASVSQLVPDEAAGAISTPPAGATGGVRLVPEGQASSATASSAAATEATTTRPADSRENLKKKESSLQEQLTTKRDEQRHVLDDINHEMQGLGMRSQAFPELVKGATQMFDGMAQSARTIAESTKQIFDEGHNSDEQTKNTGWQTANELRNVDTLQALEITARKI